MAENLGDRNYRNPEKDIEMKFAEWLFDAGHINTFKGKNRLHLQNLKYIKEKSAPIINDQLH